MKQFSSRLNFHLEWDEDNLCAKNEEEKQKWCREQNGDYIALLQFVTKLWNLCWRRNLVCLIKKCLDNIRHLWKRDDFSEYLQFKGALHEGWFFWMWTCQVDLKFSMILIYRVEIFLNFFSHSPPTPKWLLIMKIMLKVHPSTKTRIVSSELPAFIENYGLS